MFNINNGEQRERLDREDRGAKAEVYEKKQKILSLVIIRSPPVHHRTDCYKLARRDFCRRAGK